MFDFRFYVIPFSANHVSAYIARMDSWYYRHIYVPCRSPILPWLRTQQQDNVTITNTNMANTSIINNASINTANTACNTTTKTEEKETMVTKSFTIVIFISSISISYRNYIFVNLLYYSVLLVC